MLLNPYRALKSQLSSIEGIKLIDWFNDQYEGTIHTAPALFVEFPNDLRFETLSKKIQQAPFMVRIHTVSKVIAQQDNSINETSIENHDMLCDAVYDKLQGFRKIENDKLLFNSLSRSNYQHHQYLKGWMITTQDFEAMIYQHEQEPSMHPKPSIEIITE